MQTIVVTIPWALVWAMLALAFGLAVLVLVLCIRAVRRRRRVGVVEQEEATGIADGLGGEIVGDGVLDAPLLSDDVFLSPPESCATPTTPDDGTPNCVDDVQQEQEREHDCGQANPEVFENS